MPQDITQRDNRRSKDLMIQDLPFPILSGRL
jgi:hypothetical protein